MSAVRRASAVVLVVVFAVAGWCAPATANGLEPLDSICYIDWVCLFEDDGYYGDKYEFSAVSEGDRDIGGWNGDNEISSLKNRSAYFLCLYEDDEQGGDWIRLASGAYVFSLDDSYNFDNEAESFRLTTGSC